MTRRHAYALLCRMEPTDKETQMPRNAVAGLYAALEGADFLAADFQLSDHQLATLAAYEAGEDYLADDDCLMDEWIDPDFDAMSLVELDAEQHADNLRNDGGF